MKEAAGPTISALPDIDVEERLVSYNLTALRPSFIEYPTSLKVIRTKERLPDPKNVTPSDPEIVDYWYVTPGVEPTVGFSDFIQGVACTSWMVDQRYQNAIHETLITVAERVVSTGNLPSLSGEFASNVQRSMQVILGNNEPSSWRGLLAFSYGSYWLLGFIENPTAKRGTSGLSPLEYVDGMIAHFAPLGWTPR